MKKFGVTDEKNPVDTSGSKGMQKLFVLEPMKNDTEIINLFLKSGWNVKKIKETDTGTFILIEYVGLEQ